MKDTRAIKTRLAAIQRNFNPEKNTYKVIEYVVNNDLTYNEMLMELSKIKGFSKYPEQLKNEYISIINDIKENIINQRKQEEAERQRANTKELKDIIDSLEKTRVQYITKQVEQQEEILDVEESVNNNDIKSESVIEKKDKDIDDDKKEEERDLEELSKVKKGLVVGVIVVIILIIAAVLFY